MKVENVILVDVNDKELGVMEKLQAHKEAILHRAFSVFIFDNRGNLILQRRALEKYHSPGLWTNTCCSHPRPGETNEQAAHRRLKEEMGFDCELEYKFNFIYKAELDKGLTEHELDHVFFGTFDGPINFNPEEVAEVKSVSLESVKNEMLLAPEKYTEWFKIIFDKVNDIKNGFN